MKMIRQMKAYQCYRDSEFKLNEYPEIRLRGKWIETAGIKANDPIRVSISKGGITITKNWEQIDKRKEG